MTTCGASASPIFNTENLTFFVTVTGNSPTGLVTIKDNGATLATATLVGGSANAVFKLRAPRLHMITATYGGDGSNSASTCGAVPVQVTFDPALQVILLSDE